MSAIKKLEPFLEKIVLLPPSRVGVRLPGGTCIYFTHDKDAGKWREYLAVPGSSFVSEDERQEAWEIFHGFLNQLR